ncbi:hypothetical protein [Candidatus Tisiphia endosymbiont of Sialis lutaria]|uniref:hypothetical protein n=1 Tax=Candidatus Tisiphia endosymbiont of Sialis lutaria TaxID=2029164 RepID=UPI00312C6ED6
MVYKMGCKDINARFVVVFFEVKKQSYSAEFKIIDYNCWIMGEKEELVVWALKTTHYSIVCISQKQQHYKHKNLKKYVFSKIASRNQQNIL